MITKRKIQDAMVALVPEIKQRRMHEGEFRFIAKKLLLALANDEDKHLLEEEVYLLTYIANNLG